MPIRDYSQTAASNTAISSINIAEGCPPSNINDAIRQALADIRELQANSTIASAATTNIGAANAEYLAVSGTTTITAFDTVAAGVYRVLKFDGILTLTHNGTSLILPSAANITTAAGDVGGFRSLGSGNWRCEWFQKASGAAVVSTSGTVTSIVAGSGLTGGPITSSGTLSLDVNGLTEDTAPAHLTDYLPSYDASAAGNKKVLISNVGRVVQQVYTSSTSRVAGTTTTPLDDTIPQNTEGVEMMTLAVTPKSTSHVLLIEVVCYLTTSNNAWIVGHLHQDSTANALAAGTAFMASATGGINFTLRHRMTAGTTSATTFKFRAGANGASTIAMNEFAGTRILGGVCMSSITITELTA